MPTGNNTYDSLARLTSINITFEYAARLCVISGANIDPVSVAETAALFPGGFMTQESANNDRVYIRPIAQYQ